MKSQYIQLLEKQILKLDHNPFELEAWKTSAIAIIQRIFGQTDARVFQIENLKIDYSSWMLRDSNSNYKPEEVAKLKGKEILSSAIDEIELFGDSINGSNKENTSSKDPLESYRKMPEKERKKHFSGMKKDMLIALLIDLTK